MPEFAYPLVFLLLIPLLIGAVWQWMRMPAAIGVPAATLYRPNANKSRRPKSRHFILLLEVIAGALIITALARPQQSIEVVPITKEGTDIMIVLDFSNSMDLYDPEPGNTSRRNDEDIVRGTLVDRLAVARQQIGRFIGRRSGDRIGLAIFGHRAYTACPPTLDHDFLTAQIDQLINTLLNVDERGTNIAAGLAAGINSLIDNAERRKTIILITDGENTINDPVFTPLEAARLAAEKDITIHAVAIGSDFPHATPDREWILQNKSFNTKAIEQLATTANGRFFRSTDTEGFETVMDTIDTLETTSRTQAAIIYRRDLFPPLCIAAGSLLLLAFILRRTLLNQIA